MPSNSLQTWLTIRATDLDDLETAFPRAAAHRLSRTAQQLIRAYALMLSAQFQAFCRDLHSECLDHMIHSITPVALFAIVEDEFRWNRKLDQGNPTPGNIGADFGRLGISFWPAVQGIASAVPRRRVQLEEM